METFKCKSLSERFTSYQFNDPNPTIPTYRNKDEKKQ